MQVVTRQEMAMLGFIDVEGVFDNTGIDSIRAAAERRHMFNRRQWNGSSGCLTTNFQIKVGNGASITIRTSKGCSQGDVLSPLLWSPKTSQTWTHKDKRYLDFWMKS
jgi:hypothetical protein